MSEEDIKSPLPPRKITTAEPETTEAPAPVESVRSTITENEVAPTAPVKKNDSKKYLKIGGIVAGGIIILLIIIKVVMSLMAVRADKSVTLNYWGLWEDQTIMNGVIADFEAKNPNIKINYVTNQKDDYRTRLAGRLAKSSETTDIPDIFRIHNTWLPMFKDSLAPVPTNTSKNLALDTDFFDTYKSLKSNNQYLAIPLMYDGLALFYNKDLIEAGQVGLPKSWWDLKTIASKLTVKDENGKIKVAGAAMGLTDNVDHWSDILGLMMKQNGVNPLLTDANNLKKLQDVLTFYTLFLTQDKVWDQSLPNSTQLFANGKLAFYFGPSWSVFNINDLNKNLRYEVMPVPQLPTLDSISSDSTATDAQLTNIHWASYWVEGVNNKSNNQPAAWKFLEYLASKEGLEKMYATESQTREFGEIYPRKSMVSEINTNSKVKAFVNTANDAESWYLAADTHDAGVNDEMRKYFADAINSIALNNDDINKVMATLENGIAQIKNKYQLK